MENGWESPSAEGPGERAEEWQGLIAPFLAGHQGPITSTRNFLKQDTLQTD